jgi:hypothetical protein
MPDGPESSAFTSTDHVSVQSAIMPLASSTGPPPRVLQLAQRCRGAAVNADHLPDAISIQQFTKVEVIINIRTAKAWVSTCRSGQALVPRRLSNSLCVGAKP